MRPNAAQSLNPTRKAPPQVDEGFQEIPERETGFQLLGAFGHSQSSAAPPQLGNVMGSAKSLWLSTYERRQGFSQTRQIVNNESAEILRMFNSEFQNCASNPELDLYPEDKREQIDELNDWIYPGINNGVYRCGFATEQAAYSRAFEELFSALDRAEKVLAGSRYLASSQLTEADVRLFTTLVRFDSVYVSHFKCDLRRIVDYPNLWGYTRDLYQTEGVAETVDMNHIKTHYFVSHRQINPSGIIPDGPVLDFESPHGRD